MKYLKTYETLYKKYKENEPIEVENFSGNDIEDVSNMKNWHLDIYRKYKFKIDDYVKYNGDINWVDKDDIYQVKTVQIGDFEKWKRMKVYCIYSITNYKFGVWVKQEDISRATTEDIKNFKIKKAGEKYNL